MEASRDIQGLLEIMRALRDPETGCPWDIVQDFKSIYPYTIEEAYEVADAIEREDMDDLRLELGDLLLQSVYHAQMASEANHFDFGDVVEGITAKMIRRHPHVFGDRSLQRHELDKVWHETKAKERQSKALTSVLDDIPLSLPALTRAQKLQRRAANEGFDWSDVKGVLAKLDEETDELKQALSSADHEQIEEEIGDMLFTLVNLSRHLSLDAETSLRRSANKFEQRYRTMETLIEHDGEKVSQLDTEQLETYWQQVKQQSN